MTYAHPTQTTQLPRLVNGTTRGHLALSMSDGDFDVPAVVAYNPEFDLHAPMDACDACPPYGAPALACDLHGYIFSREQYDRKGIQQFEDDQDPWFDRSDYCCEFCSNYDHPMYADYYDYYDDNFGFMDNFDEEDVTNREIFDFYDDLLHEETPAKAEPWQQTNSRHYDAKYKRTHREAINRSASHRRRDKSVHARGRHDHDNRRYEVGATPRHDFRTKKESEI